MVKIFIEAEDKNKPESGFLRAILNTMGIAPDAYEIMPTGGYTNLLDSDDASNIGIMQANTDVGGKNIVVFDADSPRNYGGFAKRRNDLLKKKDELGLDFDLFLWPDNQHDGDVEMLMETTARRDLYPEFFECFDKYEQCILQRKDTKGNPLYTTPNLKGKLHTYFHALPISKSKKDKFGRGEWRWNDTTIWDLNADSLVPIKTFLSKYLN